MDMTTLILTVGLQMFVAQHQETLNDHTENKLNL